MTLKQSVLQILEQNREASLSGQEIAGRLNVSRSAVWKAIHTLKKDGYMIHSVTNCGYRIADETDLLSVEGVRPYLDNEFSCIPIYANKVIDSTNNLAKKLAVDGAEHGTLVLAEEQTNGRGRHGRSFYSPPETGLYMSLILRPKLDVEDAGLITTAAAVAVCRAIENLFGIESHIKWINDIYLQDKKVCGILTEAVTDFESGSIESIVVGVGINVTLPKFQFPSDLNRIAGTLFQNEIPIAARNRLAAEVTNQILKLLKNMNRVKVIQAYKKRCFVLEQNIIYYENHAWHNAYALDIDRSGGLVVRDQEDKIKILNSGEISIRRKNK